MACSARTLKSRWKEPPGTATVERLVAALTARDEPAVLHELLTGMQCADEVAPAPDLRGINLDQVSNLWELELPGARFDGATLGANLVDCHMPGAVFDRATATNLSIGREFTGASFIASRFKGCHFTGSVLVDADFTDARLQSAMFGDTDCRRASFRNADLRFAGFDGADLSGADLSDADLTEGSLLRVRHDEKTKLVGAKLDGAYLDEDLRALAEQANASLAEAKGAFEVAGYDATIAVLERRNQDGHLNPVIAAMRGLRDRVAANSSFDWSAALERDLPEAMWNEVLDAYEEGGSNLPEYT
jgi:uncharacterized protein YjbI with pentapeptide repeats